VVWMGVKAWLSMFIDYTAVQELEELKAQSNY
jgi:hypothetical protein